MDATDALDLADLPPLPQVETIALLCPRLWADGRVRAIWLGGSLASGAGDRYGDIDLRIAVAPDDLAAWEAPDLAALLDDLVLGRQFLRFGPGSFLHHLILANGDILDFLVQSTDAAPVAERVRILGCRDDVFAAKLAKTDQDAPATPAAATPVRPEAVRELLVAFWINSHKHRKVLHRDLDLMFPAGAFANFTMLMRLWYIEATGEDTLPLHFSGIHGLTALVRAVEGCVDGDPLALLGAPTRNRGEIEAEIEAARGVVARIGRRLAARHGFEYPEALEAMVLREWAAFKAGSKPDDSTGQHGG
jgi:hypothetical protein